ncbi:MAG: cytochrome P450 [Dehalococcoidia bacterium]
MAIYQPNRPAYSLDPYSFLHRLRAEEPVYRSRELSAWVVTSFAEGQRVLTDDAHFSPDPTHEAGELGAMVRRQRATMPLGGSPILGNSDPPEHTRLRAIVNRAFTPRAVEAFQPEVEAMVSDLLLGWRPGEPFEVMGHLAQPLAITAVLAYLGVPPGGLGLFHACAADIMKARSGEAGPGGAEAALRARTTIEEYLRAESPGGVIGELLSAEAEGQLTFDDLVMLLIHISLAGNGPLAYAIGNALLALATHTDQFAALRAGPTLVRGAVEECLRFDTPTHVVHRFVTAQAELNGRKLRPGETVAVVVGAANRDPARFPDPDVFDVTRDATGQLAFGHGIHFCLGAPLARTELAAVLGAVADRFAKVKLAEGGLRRGDTFLLRGPSQLVLVGESDGHGK